MVPRIRRHHEKWNFEKGAERKGREKQRSGTFYLSHTTVSTELTANLLLELMELKGKWEGDKAGIETFQTILNCLSAFRGTCCISHFDYTAQKNTQLSNLMHICIILQVGERGLIWQSKRFQETVN